MPVPNRPAPAPLAFYASASIPEAHRPVLRGLALATLLSICSLAAHAQTLSATDGSGDPITPTQYLDLPVGGPFSISGDQIEWTVPNFLLPSPIVDWRATSITLDPSFSITDALPDTGLIMTTGGTVGDPSNDQGVAERDILSAAILVGGSETTFQYAVRDLPGGGPALDTRYFFSLNHNDTMDLSTARRSPGVFPFASASGWALTVLAGAGHPNGAFPFTPKTYYDIVAGRATLAAAELVIEFDVAGAPPSPPQEVQETPSYTPVYNVALNADGDVGTGSAPFGIDWAFFAYFDQNGNLQGGSRQFDEVDGYFELDPLLPVVSRVGATITVRIPINSIALFDGSLYLAALSTQLAVWTGTVEPGDNAWFNTTDTLSVGLTPLIFKDGFENGGTSLWN